jgi:enoyl-CoA hydratase
MEMLFELESLFAWCTSRIEINSIFINSSSKMFSKGIEKGSLKTLSSQNLEKIFIKLQKIVFAMMQLPQTIVFDLGEGSELFGSEFALGADLRIASHEAKISFEHLKLGLIPGAGGLNMLSTFVGTCHAKNWIQSPHPVTKEALLSSGFLKSFYHKDEKQKMISSILTEINSCAPVQRIQAKLALFESIRTQIEAAIVIDRKVTKAALISEDWKKDHYHKDESEDFMPAKSMSYAVKLSLIKTEDLHS